MPTQTKTTININTPLNGSPKVVSSSSLKGSNISRFQSFNHQTKQKRHLSNRFGFSSYTSGFGLGKEYGGGSLFETRRGTSNLSAKLMLDKEPGSQTTRKPSLATLPTAGQTTCRTLEGNEEGSMITSQFMDTETSPRLVLTVQSKKKQLRAKR